MKSIISLLPLAALASAIVVPDQAVFAQLPLENDEPRHHDFWSKLPSIGDVTDRIGKSFKDIVEDVPQTLDDAFARANLQDDHDISAKDSPFASWIEDSLKRLEEEPHGPDHDHPHGSPPHGPPPHGPPPHGPPPHGPPPHGRPPHGPPPPPGHEHPPKKPSWMPHWPGHKEPKDDHHKHGHHGHHHGPGNLTIYQMISKSNYTTNLTALIDEDKELVKLLNSTTANYTLFAPTDYAFSKLPKHGDHKPPKELIKKVLLYHILPDLYPAFKLLFAHTAPTLLETDTLGGHPQRVLVKFLGLLRGVRVNYYAPVVAPNIPASNGIIHGLSSILLPPPPALSIISHLPNIFSTFELALIKTDLYDSLNTTGKDTVGGTLFAPTNTAFRKLGPRANGFLFSSYGAKYLKALLEYHVVPKRTLYSTAFYDGKKSKSTEFFTEELEQPKCHHHKDVSAKGGYVHIDLPTALEGKPLSIDIIRRGPFIEFKINAFVHVAVQDGLAKDGVIQVVNDILLPPKRPGEGSADAQDFWNGEGEISVDELVERLEPFVGAEVEDEMKLDF